MAFDSYALPARPFANRRAAHVNATTADTDWPLVETDPRYFPASRNGAEPDFVIGGRVAGADADSVTLVAYVVDEKMRRGSEVMAYCEVYRSVLTIDAGKDSASFSDSFSANGQDVFLILESISAGATFNSTGMYGPAR